MKKERKKEKETKISFDPTQSDKIQQSLAHSTQWTEQQWENTTDVYDIAIYWYQIYYIFYSVFGCLTTFVTKYRAIYMDFFSVILIQSKLVMIQHKAQK